jgi:hypothetical protein
MKHLKKFNEEFDPMGSWDPNHPSNKKEEPVAKPKYQVKNDRIPYYDADITKKVDKSHFNKYDYQVQYKIGDKVKVKDGRKIKEVTITDIKETPYKNVAGGNAFVPHSFTYTFENLKTFESVDDTWKPIYKEWLSRPFTISKIERKNTKLSQQDLLNMFKRELESKGDWNTSWDESHNDACESW